MAIFRCVGYFYFHVPDGTCFVDRHTPERAKLTKKTRTGKHKWKRTRKEKTSEADSFRNMKVKIPYTPEDGHVGRNM
jgi:hypothetical protein